MDDAFDQLLSGIARFHGDVHDFTAARLEIAPVKSELQRCVGEAFDEHVGHKLQEKRMRRRAVERCDEIHGGQRRYNFHSFTGRHDGTRCLCGVSKPLANARIPLNGNRKKVSERSRLLEKTNVPGMQQVKSPRRAHHSPAVAFPSAPAENQPALRDNLSQPTTSQSLPAKSRKAPFYHARSECRRARSVRHMKRVA